MQRNKISFIVFTVLLAIPLCMWLCWKFTAKKKMVIAIVDKTVLTRTGQEHASLAWVLNHQRYTKNKSSLYNVSDDYYGFFPGSNEQFRLKGLERFSTTQLEQLSKDADLAYITDAYGIYKNEWFARKDFGERSNIIYGGLSTQDMQLLEDLKSRHKLIITEFNTIGSPAAEMIRVRFEQSFALRWTGWVGRYFSTLDTAIDKEIPHWLINGYKRNHQGSWPFKKEGIALVSDKDQVVILENGKHLNFPLPVITTEETYQRKYHLPSSINYSFWFDIINTDTSINKITSWFNIKTTDTGRAELARYGIPFRFPAVQTHQGKDYQFWYFSGDFCDNPVTQFSSYFKGVEWFKFLFLNRLDKSARKSFFWRFYQPLLTTILDDYYQQSVQPENDKKQPRN